jgi:rhodanese-related sulfurtransferase
VSEPLKIGRYQLENLLRNGVRFQFFDLSEDVTSQHELLTGSRKLRAESALEEINAMNLSKDAPIVLICENSVKSMDVARRLEQNSYLNVYVFEGGRASLGE